MSPREAGTFRALYDQLPRDPHRRGKAFERLCQWFLETEPIYRSQLRKVWLWDDWPGRWGADAGIDLVAETNEGELWAVQAKAYGVHNRITKRDVDTFLSESSRAAFSFRLLIASTDLIGRNAQQVIENQRIQVGTVLLGQLNEAAIAWPASFLELAPSEAIRKEPRPHQLEAVKHVVSGLKRHDRGQLVMACGTGKTLTALYVAESLKAATVLVLVPSLSLLAQVLREWLENATDAISFLAVCSDASVVDDEDAMQSTSELGVPVTTDPIRVTAFLRSKIPGRRVVFSTYHSTSVVAAAQRSRGTPWFDLVVADEAHRLTGDTASPLAQVLHSRAIRGRKRLFMTATPRIASGIVVGKARQRGIEVASMDDLALFGPRLHTITFGKAISDGLLTDYRVVIVGVDDETHAEWTADASLVRSSGVALTDARTLAMQVAVIKAYRDFGLRRAISFHGLVKSAKSFSETLSGVFLWMSAERAAPVRRIHADHVSGKMSAGDRRARLQVLRDPSVPRALITNARCLTEGIDVPSIDGVVFVDPKRSRIDIVQAIGRAIRLDPDKVLGTVVVPVFLEKRRDGQVSAFKAVFEVLNAMRAHDSDLADELDGLRRGLGARPDVRPQLPGKILLDLPKWVTPEFVNAVQLWVIEETTETWEQMFGLLERYTSANGNSRPPIDEVLDGARLGGWVGKQRDLYRAGLLREDRKARLEVLPGWTWDARTTAWDDAFLVLLRFVEETGTAQVPARHIYAGFPLGNWAGTQRRNYKTGLLSLERISRLESVPGWVWDIYEAAWEEGCRQLLRYIAREGDALVPTDHLEEGFPLGRWVAGQRAANKDQLLSVERREWLEARPGWAWHRHDASWNRGYRSLLRYVAKEGSAKIPYVFVDEDDFNLGGWVTHQRGKIKRNALPEERRKLLEALPGWTSTGRRPRWRGEIRRT